MPNTGRNTRKVGREYQTHRPVNTILRGKARCKVTFRNAGRDWLFLALARLGKWERVAAEYGLPNRAVAWNMAHGKQPIPRALFERMSGLDRIKRIAVPFLEERDKE